MPWYFGGGGKRMLWSTAALPISFVSDMSTYAYMPVLFLYVLSWLGPVCGVGVEPLCRRQWIPSRSCRVVKSATSPLNASRVHGGATHHVRPAAPAVLEVAPRPLQHLVCPVKQKSSD